MKNLSHQRPLFALACFAMALIVASFIPFGNPTQGSAQDAQYPFLKDIITKPDNCSIEEMLNATWTETENNWSGTWTPTGEIVKVKEGTYSRTYKATWSRSKPKGRENDDIPTSWYAKHFLITISGNEVTVSRKDPEKVGKYPAGAQCTYNGTIINNSVKDGTGGCGNWTAIIEC